MSDRSGTELFRRISLTVGNACGVHSGCEWELVIDLHFGEACILSSLVLDRCLRAGGENLSTTRSFSVGILRKEERDIVIVFGE